jgi:PAS domain-containing protein
VNIYGVDISDQKELEEKLREAYENLQVQSEKLQAQSEELQEANGALHESEERYRMLFSNMNEGFFLGEPIYDKGGKPYDYRTLEVNSGYERNLGVKKEQVLGKSILEVDPNASPIAIKKYGEVALSGESTHFELFSQVVNRYLDFHAFSPEIGKFAVIFTDITECKLMEIALKKNEQHLNDILSSAKDGIFELDKE